MAKEATPPTLTDEDRQAIADILAQAKTLPCGGRTWEGPFNRDQPIYRLIGTKSSVPVRRLVKALAHEQETGALQWANVTLYPLHWGCIDHVTTNRAKRADRPEPEPGYVVAYQPAHPVARANGLVLEHRAVLHDKLGAGPQRCHWDGCGHRELLWEAAPGEDDELTVDHLDHDRANNDPANLVPACRPCNAARRRGVDPRVAHASHASEPQPVVEAPQPADQEPTPATPATRGVLPVEEKGETSETSPAVGAWARLRRSRPARAAAVALAVAVGSGAMVTSPAAFLPGAQVDRGGDPPATTSTAPPSTPALEAPADTTSSTVAATSTTARLQVTIPTLGEPCTPSHCPRLGY